MATSETIGTPRETRRKLRRRRARGRLAVRPGLRRRARRDRRQRLRFVEQVASRMSTGRAALVGLGEGALLGMLFAFLFGIFFTGPELGGLVLYSVTLGGLFGSLLGAYGQCAPATSPTRRAKSMSGSSSARTGSGGLTYGRRWDAGTVARSTTSLTRLPRSPAAGGAGARRSRPRTPHLDRRAGGRSSSARDGPGAPAGKRIEIACVAGRSGDRRAS
jgi:hypothetical protein